MNISFSGKSALVTGAGQGIGREIAKKLVACGAARVVAVSRTKAHLESLKEELPEIEIVCVDLSNWEETKQKLAVTGSTIDLLVNNAGFAQLTPVGEIGEAICDKHFDINVKAIINLTQMVAKGMIKRGKGGAIVNISSQAGIVALKDHLVYCASKAAVDQLTRCFALEYGSSQIRINSVNPTVTLTAMAMVGWSDPVKAAEMKAKIPLGRFAEPVNVVDTVLFLLSPLADMITGTVIPIDGGFTAC